MEEDWCGIDFLILKKQSKILVRLLNLILRMQFIGTIGDAATETKVTLKLL